jgi:hypothetical protein
MFFKGRYSLERHEMKLNIALAGAFVVGLALPALAQTSFWVVQDKTKHCRIVEQKPTSQEWTVVGGDGTVYHSRTEAESAMKTTKVCTTD